MPPPAPQPSPPPRPMVFVALAHLAGLTAGLACPGPASGWPGTAVFVIWAIILFASLGWTGWRLWQARRIHGPLAGSGRGLLLALALIGWWQGGAITTGDRLAERQLAPWLKGDLVSVTGTVAEEPVLRPDGVDLVIQDAAVEALRVGGGGAHLGLRIRLALRDEATSPLLARPALLPLPGQRVKAWGSLKPVLDQTAPGLFEPRQFWLSHGIGARLTVTRPADCAFGLRPKGLIPWANESLRILRWNIVAILSRRLPADTMPVACALLLGEMQRITPDDRTAYSATSLTHLLSVSGLHTGFVLLLIYFFTYACGLSPRTSAWTGMIGLIFYLALTGFAPPVARATVMALFLLGGFALKRHSSTLASLATAAFITLLLEPRNLLRLDWQLSYACAVAMLLCATPIYELIAVRHRAGPTTPAPHTPLAWPWRLLNKYLLLPLAVTLAIQLLLMPIQVGYFRQFNVLSFFFNIVGVELTLFAMTGLVLTALFGWVPWLGAGLGLFAGGMLHGLEGFVHWGGSLSQAVILTQPPPLWLMAVYYGIVLGGAWLRTGEGNGLRLGRRQMVSLALALGLSGLFMAWAPLLGGREKGMLDFYMLDVGQGDSLVTRFPNGKVMVVDGGPAADSDNSQGRLTVDPFLRTLGVDRIELLVATHADADHIGGLPWLLDHYPVGLLLQGPDTASSEIYQALKTAVQHHAVTVGAAHPGLAIHGLEPARVTVLGPAAGMQDNNASVVLRVSYGEVDLLLTGDMETEEEKRILAMGLLRDVEILKLGHHGSHSSTSEDLLAATRPAMGLISVGRHNRYGHPAPDVLRRLNAHHIWPCRTDQLGTLWVRTDGHRIQVFRFTGP